MGKKEENATRIALKWLFDAKSQDKGIADKQETQQETAAARGKAISDFFKWSGVSKYYYGFKPLHMSIGHPMDLSYAHFWGVHRIPMYLNIPENDKDKKGNGSTFYFINDYRLISKYTKSDRHSVSREGYHVDYEFDPLTEEFFEGIFTEREPLLYDFPVEEEYEKFKLFYHSGNKKPKHRLAFHVDKFEEIMTNKTIDKAQRAQEANDLFKKLDPHYSLDKSKPGFHHFLEPVPLDTIEIYEEYSQQISYYAATGFRFPLKFLPFYHLDPRRHFSKTNKSVIVDQIINHHHFHLLKECKAKPAIQSHAVMPSPSPVTSLDKKYFNQFFFEGFSDKDIRNPNITHLTQAPYKKDNEEAIYNLLPTEAGKEKGKANPKIKFPPHLFWGVKMYPPLGYAPDIYDQSKERYNLPENYYKHLEEFYDYCEKE